MVPDGGGGSLSQVLASLKRRGSALLVVGGAPDEAHVAVSRRLLGDTSTGTRRRLLVLTDGPPAVARLPRDERSEDLLTVLRCGRSTRRSALPALAPTPGSDSVDRSIPPDDLADLTATVESLVAEFEAVSGGLAPAELRVCLDSLVPLLERHDVHAVDDFVADLGTAVRDAQGMAHCHLPVPRDAPSVGELTDNFDATVEVRLADGRPEQRWRVHGADVETGWLPV